MESLRMPPSPGAPGSDRVGGVRSPGNKIIINDNIRIHRPTLAAALPRVQVCVCVCIICILYVLCVYMYIMYML